MKRRIEFNSRNNRVAVIGLLFFLSISFLTAQPGLSWAKTIGSAARVAKTHLDGTGNVVVTGTFNTALDFDPGNNTSVLIPNGQTDLFIAKFNSAGNFLWAINLGDNTCIAYLNDLVIDSLNSIYITGTFNGSCSNNIDYDPSSGTFTLSPYDYLAKYDSLGNFLWAKQVGGTALQVDYSNDLVIASVTNMSGFKVVRYTPAGVATDSLAFSGITSDVCKVKRIKFNSGNEMYLAGTLDGTIDIDAGSGTTNISGNDLFFAKYNSSWVFQFGNKAGVSYGVAEDLLVDGAGDIFLTGYDASWSNYYNTHLSKWNSSGAPVWNKVFTQNTTTVKSQGLKLNKNCNGDLQLMGVYSDNCGNGGTKYVFDIATTYSLPCAASYTSGQGQQIFVATVNTNNGSLTNVFNMGGNIVFSSTYNMYPAIYTDGETVLIGGLFGGTTNLDFAGSIPSYTAGSSFFARYDNCNVGTAIQENETKTKASFLYPNPSSSEFSVYSPNSGVRRIIVRDISGRVLLESSENKISIFSIDEGAYVAEVVFEGGSNQFFKFLKVNSN